MPVLRTVRLRIRPFVPADLDAVHRIQDIEFSFVGGEEGPLSREQRQAYLVWAAANHTQLGNLYQPPFGDKAMVLAETGEVIGVCGLVPAFGPFGQFFTSSEGPGEQTGRQRVEIGLYYQVAREQQRQGYATEAARALAEYVLETMRAERVIATTTYDNAASIAVMRRLGMTIYHNPLPFPEWFQVVGILEASTCA